MMLLKDWIQKHRPGAGILRHTFLHFLAFSDGGGPLFLPKREIAGHLFILFIEQ